MNNKIPRVGIGIFVFKNGKFLMGCRKGSHGDGSWSIPGGHLEFGETIEQGAEREVLEETGLQIKNINIAGITNDIFSVEDKHYITIWVTSEWKKGKPTIKEPDKFLDLEWRNFETLPENLFLPWVELQKSKFYKNIKKLLIKHSS
jgi:8-oxo-dGTP diphosphatase